MDVGKDKIKDLFSSRLGSFEPEVPASVWGGLDQLLSAEPTPAADTSSSTSSTAAGKSSLLKIIIAVVGLTVAIATGIFLLNRQEDEIVLEEPKLDEPVVVIDSVTIIDEDTITIDSVKISNISSIKSNVVVSEEEPVEEEQKEAVGEEEKPAEEIVEEKQDLVRVKPEDEIRTIPLREEERGRGLSIGIVSDLGLAPYTQKNIGGHILLSRKVRTEEFLNALEEEGSEFILKHSKPVSFGITIEKELNSKLSLETGLMYTYLSSELTSASKYNIRETQSFNYIGIPVALNYTFCKVGGAKFFLSIGAMMQKDIKGKYISHLDLPNPDSENSLGNNIFYKEPYYIKKDLKQINPQFSVRTKLGVAYPLYKKLYIYGAIGGVYYFDANNKYRTIYSDKEAQLDLNLGVKYEF